MWHFTVLVFISLLSLGALANDPPFFFDPTGTNVCQGNLETDRLRCLEGLDRVGGDFGEFSAVIGQMSRSIALAPPDDCFPGLRRKVRSYLEEQLRGVDSFLACTSVADTCTGARCARGLCTANAYEEFRDARQGIRENFPLMRRYMAMGHGMNYSSVYDLGNDIPDSAMRHPHNSDGLIKRPELLALNIQEKQAINKEMLENLKRSAQATCTSSDLTRWQTNYGSVQVLQQNFNGFQCERRGMDGRVLESRHQFDENLNPLDLAAGWRCERPARIRGPMVYRPNAPGPEIREVPVTVSNGRGSGTRQEMRRQAQPTSGNRFSPEEFAACLALREIDGFLRNVPTDMPTFKRALERIYPQIDRQPQLTDDQKEERRVTRGRVGPVFGENPLAKLMQQSGRNSLSAIRDSYQNKYLESINNFPFMSYVPSGGAGMTNAAMRTPLNNTRANIQSQLDRVNQNAGCANWSCSLAMTDWDYLQYTSAVNDYLRNEPRCCNFARRAWEARGYAQGAATAVVFAASIGAAVGCYAVAGGATVTMGPVGIGVGLACTTGAATMISAFDAVGARARSEVSREIAATSYREGDRRDFSTVDADGQAESMANAGLILAPVAELALAGRSLRIGGQAVESGTRVIDDAVVPNVGAGRTSTVDRGIASGSSVELPRTVDPTPEVLRDPLVNQTADELHRLWISQNRSRFANRPKPVPVQAGENADDALARYSSEGFQGLDVRPVEVSLRPGESIDAARTRLLGKGVSPEDLTIVDGKLVQRTLHQDIIHPSISENPGRLIPSLHAQLNGQTAAAYLPIARRLGTQPGVEDIIRLAGGVEGGAPGIHSEWLRLNSWAKDGSLGVPFERLPYDEQVKDIDALEAAWRVANPGRPTASTFDEAREVLRRAAEVPSSAAINDDVVETTIPTSAEGGPALVVASDPTTTSTVPLRVDPAPGGVRPAVLDPATNRSLDLEAPAGPGSRAVVLQEFESTLARFPEVNSLVIANKEIIESELLDPRTRELFVEFLRKYPDLSPEQRVRALDILKNSLKQQCG